MLSFRQKTLGQHTHCCKCDLVQGQFCGDCLYMRYGENVIEASKNPDWVCPVCRGICNCSLCSKEKGWEPTGNLYRKLNAWYLLALLSIPIFLFEKREKIMHYKFTTHTATHIHTNGKEKPSQYSTWGTNG
ncbi:putative Zinc-finger domain of monoamine-oxidase A repressor R1 [Rosa chinensis]|uniref:Putative Zinc-finger domain of monoamine-oxidase A repressor R1 n=1 Tax=Rosa chinensis TaxID=74649 RepID=A0A2P6PMZ2_ROSCH|nr:putative Zinc-finger domain of monoamine-oxidase A repressor R1 [Rosa chinensis]